MANYQPWYVGQTYPAWDIPLNTDVGADDLTGVDSSKFTMIFRNTAVAPPVDTTGTGAFRIKTVYPAEILYKPSTADVATPFSGVLIIRGYFPPSGTNTDAGIYDPLPFVITGD